MRIVFMGSPIFAVPSLEKLAESFNVVGVYCQPDKPAGRGKKLKSPAVKQLALELGIKVHQPPSVKDHSTIRQLEELEPELIIVVAYGRILPEAILNIPDHGTLNVHASLLPRWRGAAPIPASILHGDQETGVTIMQLVPEMDAGDVLAQRSTPIGESETAGQLSRRLSEMGADLLLETIGPYTAGEITPAPQDSQLASFAPRIQKEDGRLDFTLPAACLERQVRAYNPWPTAFFSWEGRRIIVHESHVLQDPAATQGAVIERDGFPAVGAKEGYLVLDKVQPAGKKAMKGDEFLRGSKGILNAIIE
jgi:methionyl-tRNA formyltransferase